MAFLDDRVKQIVDTLRSSQRPFTILVVSDHGFRKTTHTIYPNAVSAPGKAWMKEENSKPAWDAWVVPDGGTAMVYVRDPCTASRSWCQTLALFTGVDGVEHVYQREDLAGLGLPSPRAKRPGAGPAACGEARVCLREWRPEGRKWSLQRRHTRIPEQRSEMQAIFLAWGDGIRPGVRLDRISNLDVAPTIAALLGIEMTNVTGRPLDKILTMILSHGTQ